MYQSGWIHTLRNEQDSTTRGGDATHASNSYHEIAGGNLWESSGRIHLVYAEGDIPGTKLFDQKVAEKVVVPGEVTHVHDFRGPPCQWGSSKGVRGPCRRRRGHRALQRGRRGRVEGGMGGRKKIITRRGRARERMDGSVSHWSGYGIRGSPQLYNHTF